MSNIVDNDLSQKKIGNLLLQYSIPAIIATTATSIYNIVDRIFIGQIVGPLAISGLTLTLPIMNIATALGTLVGSGAATMISIRLGEKRRNVAFRTLGNAIILNLIIGILFSIVGLLFIDEILTFFGASPLTLPYAKKFITIILIGNPITQMFFSLNTILRASGYPSKAMWSVLVTMFLNLILVFLFVYQLNWGIEGAALATIVGQFFGLCIILHHFWNKKSNIHFKAFAFEFRWNITRHIFSIGLSPFLLHLCTCLVVAIFNWQLANYAGDYAVGAYGIINTIVGLVTVIILGLSHGMQPIVGYNYGARQYKRVTQTFWLTVGIGVTIATIGFVFMWLYPLQIAYCFTKDFLMSELIRSGLKIYILMFPILGFQIVASNFFQSIGKPRLSIFLSISRQIIFLIPAILILPHYYGLNGIWYAMPIADFLSTILSVILFAQLKFQ